MKEWGDTNIASTLLTINILDTLFSRSDGVNDDSDENVTGLGCFFFWIMCGHFFVFELLGEGFGCYEVCLVLLFFFVRGLGDRALYL